MKEGWRIKLLGDVLRKTETVNPAAFPEVEFDYVDVSSVSNETFDIEATQRLKGKDAPSRARRLVRAKDVLFATIRPTLKRIAVTPDYLDGQVCSTGYFVMRPNDEIDSRFLFYYLFTEPFMAAMALLQKGASYPAVTDAEVRAQTIMFPPIGEQRRIVAILDEAFEGIATAKAHAERNMRNAREVFDDYLASVFSDHKVGWESAPIEQHVRFIDYRGRTPEKTSEGVRLITAKNVKRGFVQREPMEFVAPDSYDDWMTRGIPKVGDVLFTTEAPLGHVAQLDTDERVVFAQRVIIMQVDSKVLGSTFFKYLLLSAPVQAKIHAQATGATAQGIKASLLKRIEIPFPSDVAEQRLIASRLDVLAEDSSQLEDLYQRKLAALDELKQSLLHQAFSGKL